jgi:hypothetical protein
MGGIIFMPYYVYQIHTDSTNNRLYNSFDNLRDAEKLEKQMLEGRRIGDNYFVAIVKAENDQEAKIKADSLRPHP